MFRYSLILLGLIVPLVHCYSSGAPPGACHNLMPGHGYEPQQVQSPVTLSAPATVPRGSTIKLTLKGDSGNNFLGFIVRAYEDNLGSSGHFEGILDSQTLTCDSPDDSATHFSNSIKDQVEIHWTAPNYYYTTNVTFKSTVVINYSTIFLNQPINVQVLYDPSLP
ncbi:unnamed protein product [Meganyctiphanes norvegica]|uniref:Reelin domain-containing protein n=1 Tax=Meganyctiphanes norvegica TaxID=48144 RepID=A0AAV2SBK3_MEGNR